MELIVFVTFVTIQFAAKQLPSHLEHIAWIQKLGKHHWVVWLMHPAVLHGVHDYAVHFIVYSGYVLSSH